jgi:hypothetical protein
MPPTRAYKVIAALSPIITGAHAAYHRPRQLDGRRPRMQRRDLQVGLLLDQEEAMSLQFKAGVRIISLAFLIALTSCTTWAPPDPSPWHWRKEGVTIDQQRRDQAECAAASDRAYNASTGDTTGRAAVASRVAEDCFRAKGYHSPAR